jgi:hypothetical protein
VTTITEAVGVQIFWSSWGLLVYKLTDEHLGDVQVTGRGGYDQRGPQRVILKELHRYNFKFFLQLRHKPYFGAGSDFPRTSRIPVKIIAEQVHFEFEDNIN